MPRDIANILDVLKTELDFIQKGGYGRSVRTPWQATSVFQDSTSCLNLGDKKRTHPCSECVLMDFVPPQFRSETVPCHHIPLNAKGDTVEDLEVREDQRRMECCVEDWLRSTITTLERG